MKCALCETDSEEITFVNRIGLCPNCYREDMIREAERLQAVKAHAGSLGLPRTLMLQQWLAIIDDFRGQCAYCGVRAFESLDLFDHSKGVTALNCVPACKSCLIHKNQGWSRAIARVVKYLATPIDKRHAAFHESDLLRLVERS